MEIREQFVSPETALLLKKKGFDEACRYYYDTVPTQALVMKWLREKHNLFIDISLINDESEDADGRVIEVWHFWSYSIIHTLDGRYLYDAPGQFDCIEYQTYEEEHWRCGIEYLYTSDEEITKQIKGKQEKERKEKEKQEKETARRIAETMEKHDRAEYERLKAKYEKNE